MPRKEARFQTRFNLWLRENRKSTAVFELKQCATSLPFSAVKEHQLNALRAAKHGRLIHKLPDTAMGYKPLDCFCIAGADAFVVVKFKKYFYLIDVDEFIAERDSSERSSLTEDRALKICIDRDK